MAIYETIIQGNPLDDDELSFTKEYRFVNTTKLDDLRICYQGFLVAFAEEEQLTRGQKECLARIEDRFFSKGLYLYEKQLEDLNLIIDYLGYPRIVLPEGSYFQPVMPGQKSPTKESFAANGARRQRKFDLLCQMLLLGETDLPQKETVE